jgi:hypothetical protein
MGWIHGGTGGGADPLERAPKRETYVYLSEEDHAAISAWEKKFDARGRQARCWFHEHYYSWEDYLEAHPGFPLARYGGPDSFFAYLNVYPQLLEQVGDRPLVGEMRYVDNDEPVADDSVAFL